jgi:uncharacterized protein (TIGR02646 family)
MRKFQRLPEPDFLATHSENWGIEWERRRAANAKAQFHWHTVDSVPVNQKLLPLLKEQTQAHCSFCDGFPVSPPSIDTVEHFRPKSVYPREAYRWTNLYFCCMHCQQKGEKFDELLLRPDADDYEFDRYFRWDFTLGTVEVNPKATEDDQRRAEVTRTLYGLNTNHPSLRKAWLRRRAKLTDEPLDSLPYRHYLESPTHTA